MGRVKGRRARSKPAIQWQYKKGDEVVVDFDEEPFKGVISFVKKNSAVVKFEDGETLEIKMADLTPFDALPTAADLDNEELTPSSPIDPVQPGFNQYAIEWRDSKRQLLDFTGKDNPERALYFRTQYKTSEGQVGFHGEIRRSRDRAGDSICFVVDIRAQFKGTAYLVNTILLGFKDPRLPRNGDEIDQLGERVAPRYSGIQNMNADICAALNVWIWKRLQGNLLSLEDLTQRAEQPFIEVYHPETANRILLGLEQFIATCLRTGGHRRFSIEGDTFSSDRKGKPPILTIAMDLTTHAIATGGSGASPHVATESGVSEGGTKQQRASQLPGTPDNVKVLQERLAICLVAGKQGDDQSKHEAAKIRATLRRMGHKGGLRKKIDPERKDV